MRTDNRRPTTDNPYRRGGFTLVEMMVATTLVMLMMLLFAEVFEAAIGTMTAQRGIANNDQKARSFTTVLRHDLDGRTYRAASGQTVPAYFEPDTNLNGVFDGAEDLNGNGVQDTILTSVRGIIPLAPGDAIAPEQLGYLYVSENDVNDDADDVLQFTSRIVPTATGGALAPFYGRARLLEEGTFAINPNQPERDDGIEGNNAATSRAAEVSYFVRGGNLYRRVMLLRDPLPGNPPFPTQPTTGPDGTSGPFTYPPAAPGPAGPPFFNQPYAGTFPAPPPLPNSFYYDWDFSGTRVYVADTNANTNVDPEGLDEYRFHFHSLDSLDNTQSIANTPLGIPWNRFGFYSRFGFNRSVEYLFNPAAARPVYIGRFAHEETSHLAFDWPGIENGPPPGPTPNIMIRDDLVQSPNGVVAVDVNTNGIHDTGDVDLNGDRAGEDILLTNVEAFDIEVWDAGYFEDPTANGVPGFQPLDPLDDPNGNGIQDFGSWKDLGYSYTTGHYRNGAEANPAYGPGGPAGNHVYDTWHPDGGADFDVSGTVDPVEQLPPYRPLQVTPPSPYVHPTWPRPINVGEVVYPYFNASPGPENYSLGFIAVRSSVGGTSGNSGAAEPAWTPTPGVPTTDNEITWQCFDNRVGLEQIRITVRYRDVSTQQARQVTLIHSLVD